MSDQTLFKFPNESFSGVDMTATITFVGPDKQVYQRVLGELQTMSYSIHMEKRPVRSIGNVNAKDYVIGPRTIAGSLVFAVFNRHFAQDIMKETNNRYKTNTTFLVDELPPFDITISMANEYGIRSRLVVYGVRLLTEGQVMSVNDVYTENTYQFFATDIEYLNDEASYSRDVNSGLYMLTGKQIKHVAVKDNIFKTKAKDNNNPEVKQNNTITLGVQAKSPNKPNKKGLAEFMLYPMQKFGDILIYNENKEEIVLRVRNANTHIHQIELSAGTYRAYYVDKDKKSNTVTFLINPYVSKYDVSRYAPIIEVVSDSMIALYSNEPTHTHVKIAPITKNTVGEYTYHDIKNRKVIIQDLQKETQYALATCSGESTLSSPTVYAKTLDAYDHHFIQLKKFVEANANLLRIKVLSDYYNIIDLAKNKANLLDIYKSPSDAISLIKLDLEKKMKGINPKADNALELQLEYEYKIKLCLELLFVTAKLKNDNTLALNKESNSLNAPTHELNDSCYNIFTFSPETTSAEIFKLNRNFAQLAAIVPSYNFNEIDKKPNSFRFLGKPGANHYVYALNETARSPKLEFYVMSESEKQEFLKNLNSKESLSLESKEQVNRIIVDKIPEAEDSKEIKNRAFMYEVKKLENATILPPQIYSVNEKEVTVMPNINNLITNSSTKEFYLAIASTKEVEDNDIIYKIKFTNLDEKVVINYLDHGIKNKEQYILWIEDIEMNQISNATTFTCSDEDNENDQTVKEYELKEIVNSIKYALSSCLSEKDLLFIASSVENNEEVNSNNIVLKTLEAIAQLLLTTSEFVEVMNRLKDAIGINGPVNNDMISDTFYNGTDVYFNCNDINSSLIVYSLSKEGTLESHITKSELINNINLKDYSGDHVIIFAINNDLKHKSNILIVDKIKWHMEVI